MSIPRRKEPMASLVRELRLHNRHQEALVSGKAMPVETEDEASKNNDQLARFDEASSHPYECDCELCREWWSLVPPEDEET